jgi:hypothetical protein
VEERVMGSVQGLKRVVDNDAQEKKAVKPEQQKQPFYTSSLFWTRVGVVIILSMAALLYFFFSE